jgi:hypothetical protein
LRAWVFCCFRVRIESEADLSIGKQQPCLGKR